MVATQNLSVMFTWAYYTLSLVFPRSQSSNCYSICICWCIPQAKTRARRFGSHVSSYNGRWKRDWNAHRCILCQLKYIHTSRRGWRGTHVRRACLGCVVLRSLPCFASHPITREMICKWAVTTPLVFHVALFFTLGVSKCMQKGSNSSPQYCFTWQAFVCQRRMTLHHRVFDAQKTRILIYTVHLMKLEPKSGTFSVGADLYFNYSIRGAKMPMYGSMTAHLC